MDILLIKTLQLLKYPNICETYKSYTGYKDDQDTQIFFTYQNMLTVRSTLQPMIVPAPGACFIPKYLPQQPMFSLAQYSLTVGSWPKTPFIPLSAAKAPLISSHTCYNKLQLPYTSSVKHSLSCLIWGKITQFWQN